MNKNKIITLCLKILFLISFFNQSIYAASIPKWYKEANLSGYSDKDYYIGIGEGGTFQDALNNAQVYIASQLKVSISSNIESSQMSIESNDENYFKEVFSENIKSRVDETILGVETIKSKEHNKRFYVFAVLNKKKYANSLKVELDKLISSIKSLVGSARVAKKDGKIITSVQYFVDAQKIIPEFYSKKSTFGAIANKQYILKEDYSLGLILSETSDIISNINIDIGSGDRQSVLEGMPFLKPFVFNATFGKSNEPIKNMPIILRYMDGEIADKGITNDKGIFESFIIGYAMKVGVNKITAKPDFGGLPSIYKKYLKNTGATATYSVLTKPPIYFSINVRDFKGIRLKKVESKVAKNIERLGHIVNNDSEILISGEAIIIDEKEVPGKSGTQYLATAELGLYFSMGDNKFGSFSATGKGLSKKNAKDAKRKAYQKIKISRKKLVSMLAENENIIEQELAMFSKQKLVEGRRLISQNKFKEAFQALSKVSHDIDQRNQAIMILKTIKDKINVAKNN
ncbi:LPP20 family lipoprotein [bacterium]|nr:LPP20 family lipoprotein [bacterium]|tara:strand:- start:847 stop:2391 length:1545 start_codon:yes stop_codon:yes gene_type:complete